MGRWRYLPRTAARALYDEEDHDEHDDNNLDDKDDHAERADRYATGGSRESRGGSKCTEYMEDRRRTAPSRSWATHIEQADKGRQDWPRKCRMWLLPRADIDEIERKDRLCDYGLWKRRSDCETERSAAAIAGSETRYETVLPYVATSTLSD